MLKLDAIVKNNTASVAKWLRQWFVVPPFVGSIPIIRPLNSELFDEVASGCASAHLNLWDLAVQ